MAELHIVHVIPNLNACVGGPHYSVARLAAETAAHARCSIYTLHLPDGGPLPPVGDATLVALASGPVSRALRGVHPALFRALIDETAKKDTVVHSHGLWMAPHRYARKAAALHSRPFVISPRGMMEPWAWTYHRGRKRAAWLLFERANIRHASVFHATSVDEAKSIRMRGAAQPIAVIPNGIDAPDPSRTVSRAALESAFPSVAGKRLLLFLSRLHPKKGADILLRQWAALSEFHSQWHLVVAGPDTVGWLRHLQQIVDQERLHAAVTFTGPLEGPMKQSALASAEILVLPTQSENFGLVIAEALSAGTPVITTRAAPWQVIDEKKLGWWIEDTPEALSLALRAAVSTPSPLLAEMGARGAAYVHRNYHWPHIAAQMLSVYEWALRDTPWPQQVTRV